MHVATPSCPPSGLLSGDADATHQSLDITTQSKVQPYLQHILMGAGTKAGKQVEPWHDSSTCMRLSILFCFYSASQHNFGLWSLPLSQSTVIVWGSTEYGQCSQQAVRKRLPFFKVEERVWPCGKTLSVSASACMPASIFAVQAWWQSSSDRILISVSTLFYSIEKLQLVVNAEVLLGLSFF